MNSRVSVLAAFAAIWLGGCQVTEPAPTTDGTPAASADAYDYERGLERGDPVFALASETSRVDIVVRRDGPLERFGHDHVITARDLSGWLLWPGTLRGARARLVMPIESFDVDGAEARQRYALDTDPSAEDIAGTRDNLTTEVLDAKTHPAIIVTLYDAVADGDRRATAAAEFDVNGQRHTARVALEELEIDERNGEVLVSGAVAVAHADLGLEPFSVLGGGLRVAETMEVQFELRWRR